MIAEAVAKRKTVVYELPVDGLFSLSGEPDKSGSGYSAEKSPSRRHLFSLALPEGKPAKKN